MKKVLISIDETLLAEIDRTAQRAGLSRSAWVAMQAEHGLAGRRSEAERAEAARRSASGPG